MLAIAALLVALSILTTARLYRLALRRIAGATPHPTAPPPAAGTPPLRVVFLSCARADEPELARKRDNLRTCAGAANGVAALFVDGGLRPDVADEPGRVEIVRSAERVGKIAGLNRLMARADADLFVLSDANVFLEPSAIPGAVARLRDPEVGAVQLVVENRQDDAELAGALRGYASGDLETSALETRLGTMVHLDGSACLVRAACVRPIPPGMADDHALACQVLAAGRRIALHPRHAAIEVGHVGLRAEVSRKVRIACNSVSAHLHYRTALARLPGRVRLMILFHKVLRWSLPFQAALFGALAGLAAVEALGFATALGLAAAGLAAVAFAALVARPARRAVVLALLLAASGIGVARALLGARIVAWGAAREAGAAAPDAETTP